MKAFTVGDNDPYIKLIQRALNEQCGLKLVKDGGFGNLTKTALQSWQVRNGLQSTGIYDAATAAKMDPYIQKRYLKEQDFVDAAFKLSVETACVKAVQQVESRGSGFLDDGRLIILFERHWFFKLLNEKLEKNPGLGKQICQKLNLSVPAGQQFDGALKTHLSLHMGDIYDSKAGGYQGGVAEHTRLTKAISIDTECALRSASWGLFQIMGFHYALLGYASAQQMVDEYNIGERNQLLSFCQFVLKDNNLISSLRAKNWATFARWYNGPGYAANSYDTKLADAYKANK